MTDYDEQQFEFAKLFLAYLIAVGHLRFGEGINLIPDTILSDAIKIKERIKFINIDNILIMDDIYGC